MPKIQPFTVATLCALLFASVGFAHEGHQHHESSETPKLNTARGIVYDDANQNGMRDAGEQGIAGVRLSNGSEITVTDTQGRYELEIDDDDFVFVIKPRGWATSLSESNLPRFYYLHKPAGSPTDRLYAGVEPTGPLPESIDFPLHKQVEPDMFKALMFGDPQPRNVQEVEYIAHDVVEQIVAEKAHDAAFGVTLGDIAFDHLETFEPLNQAIALIGIPWYNVIGNHDLNQDAKDDSESDETFERVFGPAYYSFDYGPAHFLVLDDVMWHGAEGDQKAHYHGGLGQQQMEFIRNDLAGIPDDQLVVLMMHIPLGDVADRQELYRLIEKRPATVSISAHTHYMEHRYIGREDGWQGKEKHHHIVNVTVCGSWWAGSKDERGIPHATMSDGGPNGYSIMTFDGNHYSIQMRAAGRPAQYQMHLYAPEVVNADELTKTKVVVNVFNGSESSEVSMRVGRKGIWRPMQRMTNVDPGFILTKEREEKLENRISVDLPKPHETPHLWEAVLPASISAGTHLIQVRAKLADNQAVTDQRVIRVESN